MHGSPCLLPRSTQEYSRLTLRLHATHPGAHAAHLVLVTLARPCVAAPCHVPRTAAEPLASKLPRLHCERRGVSALTKSAKDCALPAPADLLRCAEDTLLMVMEGKVKMVCTGSEGCVPYEAPSSTSASKRSPQSSHQGFGIMGRRQ